MNLVPLTTDFNGGTIAYYLNIGGSDIVYCDKVAFSEVGYAHLTNVRSQASVEATVKRERLIGWSWEIVPSSHYFNISCDHEYRKVKIPYGRLTDGITIKKEEIKHLHSYKTNGKTILESRQDLRDKGEWIFRSREEALKIANEKTEEYNRRIIKKNKENIESLKDNYRDYCASLAYKELSFFKKCFIKEYIFKEEYIEKNREGMDKKIIERVEFDGVSFE